MKGSHDYMKRACFVISILLVASVFAGCAVFGRGKDFKPFDENALKQVTTGKTSASEVTRLFGPPNKIVKLSNGNAYVYERSIEKATGLWLVILTFGNWDKQYDRIVFFINTDDVVTHFGSSFNAETASHAMPF
jgi:predicted small secreted protein